MSNPTLAVQAMTYPTKPTHPTKPAPQAALAGAGAGGGLGVAHMLAMGTRLSLAIILYMGGGVRHVLPHCWALPCVAQQGAWVLAMLQCGVRQCE